jgi:hypothetical protein
MEQSLNIDVQTVLIAGRKDYIVQSYSEIAKKEGYQVLTAFTDEEVYKLLKGKTVNILLVGGGVEPNSRIGYREFIMQNNLETRMIEHFGGPATLPQELQSSSKAS